MKVFKVTNLSNNEYAHNNLLNHNKQDFNGIDKLYLKLYDYTIYPSVAVDSIPNGSIGLHQYQRSRMNLALNDPLKVIEYKIKNSHVDQLDMNIMMIGNKRKQITSLHEDILKEKILEYFKNYYIHDKQTLIFRLDTDTYILDVKCLAEGYLHKNTHMKIISNDINLTIINSKLLKRDLFKEDYNFEEIGIGGLNKELINIFRRALSTRAIKSSIAKKLGIKHVKGVLLYGPPGTGKTLIARKLGGMISNREPKIVNGPDIMNKYVGQSEENIRNLFSEAEYDEKVNGDNSDLHIIIFDEIDAICKKRSDADNVGTNVTNNVVNQLLSKIDGVQSLNNIFIIGMTNRKDLLDSALLRAGRIEILIEIGLPDKEGRKQIFRIHTNEMKNNNMVDKDVNIDQLAEITENYSGAEIEAVVKNAASLVLYKQLSSDKEDIKEEDIMVTNEFLLKAIKEIEPSFGNINKIIKELLPDKYIFLTSSHKDCYDNINKLIKNDNRIKTILITGETGCGKTTLSAKIALDNNIKCTKIIRPIDVVSFNETNKSYHIADTIINSYISEDSLIILDDVEILVNYAKIGNVTTFSNKLYQTLITLLKTEPINKNHKITIIATCTDPEFVDIMAKYFDVVHLINKIQKDNIKDVIKSLGYKDEIASDKNLSIREILLMQNVAYAPSS
jgi:SpoVK/Ycf46/Vps4 family AAA+-type ATPase